MRQLSALIPVLYLSYQSTDSSGYPGRTKEAINFLLLEVVKSAGDNVAQSSLTPESYKRLVFATQRNRTFWTEKRKTMLKDREQDDKATDKFIDDVFNNKSFWLDSQKAWDPDC